MKRAAVIPIALGLAALGACNQILGTPDPLACGADLGLPAGACASCIAAQCCDEASACGRHASCHDYEACALGCQGDYACRATCLKQVPLPSDHDLPPPDQCVATRSADACAVSCGVPVSPEQPDVAQQCQDCIVQRACDPARACGTSRDCNEFYW